MYTIYVYIYIYEYRIYHGVTSIGLFSSSNFTPLHNGFHLDLKL